jgi:hypothetical protein
MGHPRSEPPNGATSAAQIGSRLEDFFRESELSARCSSGTSLARGIYLRRAVRLPLPPKKQAKPKR